MDTHLKPIVIIGSGLAGYTLVRELRKLDQSQPLVMITEDDGCFYSKPMLSNALSQQKSPDRLVQANATEMEEKQQIKIRTHTKVIELLPGSHEIVLDSGERIEYQQLVLATGAKPRALAASLYADVESPEHTIFSINSLDHYKAFYQHLSDVEHVCIVGAGLIGCEFANDLLAAGKRVSVVSNSTLPLDGVIPPAMSEALLDELKSLGMQWYGETRVLSIHPGDSGGLQLNLEQQSIEADLLLSAIGLEVDLSLAAQANLQVTDAIVTDGYLQTSVADIYAIGDCAAVCGVNQKYIMPIMHAARSLASTLVTDQPAEVNYPEMPIMVKTPVYPIVFTANNQNPSLTEQIETTDNGSALKVLYFDAGNRLAGFALSGEFTKERQTLLKQIETDKA